MSVALKRQLISMNNTQAVPNKALLPGEGVGGEIYINTSSQNNNSELTLKLWLKVSF